MKPTFTCEELAEISGGVWQALHPAGNKRLHVCGISTDTRQCASGALFLALSGPRYDGHDFLEDAVAAGAVAVCTTHSQISRKPAPAGIPCLVVDDTLRTYQQLAKFHRRRFDHLSVVAVTGSSGKTSTKEIIAAALNDAYSDSLLKTAGNTNNQIGVPRNILNLESRHRVAVLELGTNSPGEICILSGIVEPTIAVLTNVGPVHLEGLGSVDGVVAEKSDIFTAFRDNHGTAVIPHSLHCNAVIASKCQSADVVTFGVEEEADFCVQYDSGDMNHSTFAITDRIHGDRVEITWRLSGVHLAVNAAAAYATARMLGVSSATAAGAIATCDLPPMRMQTIERDGVCWINDAYNANPASTAAFIEWLRSLPVTGGSERKTSYLILGDMLELGPNAVRYHETVLAQAKASLPEMDLQPIGPIMTAAAGNMGLASHNNTTVLKHWLHARVQPGDMVALKGSRGMALETLIPNIERATGAKAQAE